MWSKGGDSDVEAMSMWAQERPIGIDVDMGGDGVEEQRRRRCGGGVGDVEEERRQNRIRDFRASMRRQRV